MDRPRPPKTGRQNYETKFESFHSPDRQNHLKPAKSREIFALVVYFFMTMPAPVTSRGLGRGLQLIVFAALISFQVRGNTVTATSTVLGPTPTIVGYDSGHFYPGSDTGDWWRYAGVTGARIFVSPTEIEPSSEFPAIASTVTNAASFLNLKAAVRANPWNTNYLNWSYVTNQFANYVLTGSDYIQVDYALSTLQQLGVQAVIDSTATSSDFDPGTWPGQWQVWQYYYQEAFYLGLNYNVQRYQMYNEPDDGGPSESNYLILLQLASDAIQSALADVNAMYGKSLAPTILAPVTAGAPTSTFGSWGKLVVTNRHVNFLGQSNSNFDLIQKYDYHEYGGSPPSPSTFADNLTYLQGELTSTMSPEAPFPVTISEFNVYDGSEFNSLSTTLDTPLNYSAFGAIAWELIANGINEIYCFKISQTVGAGYPAKNGTHFVDNYDAPYNIGGITKGGEVWRLINKAMAPGRNRLNCLTDRVTGVLNLLASYDPVAQRYYLLSINNTTGSVQMNINLGAWNIATNNQVLVEAVSETCYGGGFLFTNAGSIETTGLTQGSNSVMLCTIPAQAQQPLQIIPASANAMIADGANAHLNYAGRTNLVVANNSTNTAYRSAALLQFEVPQVNPTNLHLAVLTVTASSINNTPTNECYVYGIVSNSWSESSVTWASAPNLAQNVPAGSNYTDNFVLGGGTTAFLLGQLVCGQSSGQYSIDVTSFLQCATSSNVSFLLERQVRYTGDVADGAGVSIVSKEGSARLGPSLQLALSPVTVSLKSPQMGTNGAFSFALQGTAGFPYVIQSSTNLTRWISLLTVSNATGTMTVSVTNPPSSSPWFYRAAALP